MKIMVGIDLHSNNAVCGLMNTSGKRLLHKRVPCDLKQILNVLKPYKNRIDTIAVESTYNWYWLIDGLHEQQYNIEALVSRVSELEGENRLLRQKPDYLIKKYFGGNSFADGPDISIKDR